MRRLPTVGPQVVLAGVPLLVAATVRIAIGAPTAFPTDDTYIAIHAARHLFTGIDPSYPEGAGLVGVTSPIHVVALWLVMRVLPPLWAAELLAWAGAASYLFAAATYICARRQREIGRAHV